MSWLSSLFKGSKGGSTNAQSEMQRWLDQYSYKPQYTAQTEKSLFDLYQTLTGQSGKGIAGLPFDLGQDTTGLYDATTRGIKEDYLGTGGGEGGRLADLRAYYQNLGIPEQAVNAERLGNQDMNNSLIDQAAILNDNTKNRLASLLGIGANAGENLYAQNLNQQRFNTGTMQSALNLDYGLTDAINTSNQNNLMSLLSSGAVLGTGMATGNPALIASGGLGTYQSLNGGQTAVNSPYFGVKKDPKSTAKLI